MRTNPHLIFKPLSMGATALFTDLCNTMKGVAKIILQSRPAACIRAVVSPGDTLIVMGNGPSLNDSLRDHPEAFDRYPLMAVNFAACTPEFTRLRPAYYLLADPHFFAPESSNDPNVNRLHLALSGVDWPLTLFVPTGGGSLKLPANPNITVCRYNAVGVEGFRGFERAVFRAGLAMPRPRNVLIPSLMVGIALGFKTIYITGADHSWMQTLAVTDDNVVVSVQPHFYQEDEQEQQRIRNVYRNIRLHEIVYSFYVAFKSYFAIRRYADSIGISIYNATPGSMIDAFERRQLP